MKTFKKFILEAEEPSLKAWTEYINKNPNLFGRGGKYDPKGSPDAYRKAHREFVKTHLKTGKPPEWAQFNQDVERARSSAQTPPRQPSGSTQAPPRGAQTGTQAPPKQPSASTQTPPRSAQTGTQAPPKQPKASTPPPPKPPTTSGLATTPKPPTEAPKGPGLRSRLGKLGGTALTVGGGVLNYKERRAAGQSRTQAATGATASTAGGEVGWRTGLRLGSSLGGKLAGPRGAIIGGGIGALGGAALGSSAAGGLADKLTGASKTPTERDYEKARQKYGVTQSRKVSAQSGTYGSKQGSALTGIGGKTVVSKDKKGAAFMTTGAGSQRKTVELAKTQLIRDPKTGKQVVGDLAFKGGKATYLARPSVASRDTGLGGAIRNLSRATGIGGQRERDVAAAKQEYRTALKSTQTYQKKLGITPKAATAQKLPGRGVGPKLVGPKIVGPKK